MAESGFYVVGGTLPPGSPSYVEREADRTLLAALRSGEYAYVLDSRQKGKSSLMARCVEQLHSDGIQTVRLDLQRFGANLDAERWYAGILAAIGQDLGLRRDLFEYWGANQMVGALRRLLGALEEVVLPSLAGRALVIFIDEVDYVRSLPFPTDEFFAGLRDLYNRRAEDNRFRQIAFCLVGVATPSDLIRDVRITPFNVGLRIELTDLSLNECMPLARGLGENGESLMRRIHYWTNGHPYLTQRLCQAVAADGGVRSARGVDRVVEQLFFSVRAREDDPNLNDVSRRVLEAGVPDRSQEEYRAAILDMLERVRSGRRSIRADETDPLVSVLKLSGLATVVEGYLWIRNRIYYRVFDTRWVRANMPAAEIERQRAAARRASIRTGSVVGGVAVSFAVVAAFALVQTERAEHEADRAERYAFSRDLAFKQAEANAVQRDGALVREAARRTQAENAVRQRDMVAVHLRNRVNDLRAARSAEAAARSRANASAAAADREADSARRSLYDAQLNIIQNARNLPVPEVGRVIALLEETSHSAYRGFEWAYWCRRLDRSLVTMRHYAPVACTEYSPDGRHIATAAYDGVVRIWSVASRREVQTIRADQLFVNCVAFSPDGRELAVGGSDPDIRLWDWQAGRVTRRLVSHIKGAVRSIIYRRDGSQVVTMSSDRAVRVWDIATAREVRRYALNQPLTLSFGLSPDGRLVATAQQDHTVRLWDVGTGREEHRLVGHRDWVDSLEFSPDGARIVSSGADRTVRVWDVATGKQIREFASGVGEAWAARFSPDGRRIAVGGDSPQLRIVDADTGRELLTLRGHAAGVRGLCFSRDGRQLVTAGVDCTARVWDAVSDRQADLLKGHSGQISAVTFTRDGRRIVTAASDRTARLWDARTGRQLGLLSGHKREVSDARFSPDERRIVTASYDHTAMIWDARSLRPLTTLRGHSNTLSSAAFSPDGRQIVTGSWDRTLRIWNASTGRCVRVLTGHTNEIFGAVYSPDGRSIASVSTDRTARIWDAATGRQRRVLDDDRAEQYLLAYSWDGRWLATGAKDGVVRVWDVLTGRKVFALAGHSSWVTGLAFTPDRRRLISGGLDRTVRVWSLATGREILSHSVGDNNVGAIGLSADGRMLGIGGHDGCVQIITGSEPPPLIREEWALRRLARSADLRQWPEALAALTDGERAGAGQPEWGTRSALVNASAGRTLEARRRAAALASLVPTDTASGPPTQRGASAELRRHEPEAAPTRIAVEAARALGLVGGGRADLLRVLRAVEEVRRRDPLSCQGMCGPAPLLYRLGRLTEAEAVLREDLRRANQPSGPEVHSEPMQALMALVLHASGRAQEAMQRIAQAQRSLRKVLPPRDWEMRTTARPEDWEERLEVALLAREIATQRRSALKPPPAMRAGAR